WFYDTGADVTSANYILMTAYLAGQSVAAVGTYDYDLGSGQNGSTYHYWIGSTDNATSVDRTQGWHQATAACLPRSLTISIDGNEIDSGPGGQQLDKVDLTLSGPSWRPARSAQFDDFSFVAAP